MHSPEYYNGTESRPCEEDQGQLGYRCRSSLSAIDGSHWRLDTGCSNTAVLRREIVIAVYPDISAHRIDEGSLKRLPKSGIQYDQSMAGRCCSASFLGSLALFCGIASVIGTLLLFMH